MHSILNYWGVIYQTFIHYSPRVHFSYVTTENLKRVKNNSTSTAVTKIERVSYILNKNFSLVNLFNVELHHH